MPFHLGTMGIPAVPALLAGADSALGADAAGDRARAVAEEGAGEAARDGVRLRDQPAAQPQLLKPLQMGWDNLHV